MMSAQNIVKAFASRRTQYQLTKALPVDVTIEQVQSIVQNFVKHVPTSFNSQTVRAVILTGALHESVWGSVVESIPTEFGKKRPTSAKEEAYGTVVFFDDEAAIKAITDKFPAYFNAAFPSTSNGAAQIGTWTVLSEIGLGGHLQHYNGLVEKALAGKIPESWKVQAQLVFGVPTGTVPKKEFIDNEVKVLSE